MARTDKLVEINYVIFDKSELRLILSSLFKFLSWRMLRTKLSIKKANRANYSFPKSGHWSQQIIFKVQQILVL